MSATLCFSLLVNVGFKGGASLLDDSGPGYHLDQLGKLLTNKLILK